MFSERTLPMTPDQDREFELVLGNKQLLSVLFVVFVLLGVFFAMGFVMGRNSVPVDIARDSGSSQRAAEAAGPRRSQIESQPTTERTAPSASQERSYPLPPPAATEHHRRAG